MTDEPMPCWMGGRPVVPVPLDRAVTYAALAISNAPKKRDLMMQYVANACGVGYEAIRAELIIRCHDAREGLQ
jgi:hypothetical protein